MKQKPNHLSSQDKNVLIDKMLQTRKSRNKGIPQSIFESLTQVKKEILAQESLQEESKAGDFTRTLKILEQV